MSGYSKDELNKNYKTLKLLRENKNGKIELVVRIRDNTPWLKRTYFEDKREIFGLLRRAESPYLAHIEAVFFGTDTVVLEEFIQGETLDRYLSHTSISPKQAKKFLFELVQAVSAIHRLNIIHRDIKPENIIIDKSHRLRLIDFGIARIYRPSQTKDTELLGTPGYAPPEQFGLSQSDYRTDIYSIGMVCRDLNRAAGKKRFLRKIERKCTKMDPGERYPNTAAILREFRKKRMWMAGKIAFAALFAIILCIGGITLIKQEEILEMEGDLTYEPDYNRLFVGQDTAPSLLLTESSEKKTQISLSENSEPMSIQASLTAGELSLSVTDASGKKFEFFLANQYQIIEDYPDTNTSLYGQVLFFDTDQDGQYEIWVAVSDRALVTLLDGSMGLCQNYVAGWCIYRDEQGDFCLADGQLITTTNFGSLEIGGYVIPDGIWQEYEQIGYRLKDGALTYISW